MTGPCPECATPAVAGHRFCGHCGALLVPRADDLEPSPDVSPSGSDPATPPRVALPGWVVDDEPAVAVALGEAASATAPSPDGPGSTAEPGGLHGLRRRVERHPAPVALLAVVLLLVGLGRASGPGGSSGDAVAGPGAPGNANHVDLVVPELAGRPLWQLDGADETALPGTLPWAAPAVTADRIVTVVPGAVLFHDRATGAVRRVEVPTSGTTAPVVLADGTVVVRAERDVWWLDEDGVIDRTRGRDVADVTPVLVDGDAILVETVLGALRRVERVEGEVRTVELRGVDVADRVGAPRFLLGIHAPVPGNRIWVGARGRGTDEVILFLLATEDLDVQLRRDLPTRDLPTITPTLDGVVAIAHDDVVVAIAPDGRFAWGATPGPGAEVLGAVEERVLVRHDAGRVVYDARRDGVVVARATTARLAGPRSAVAGGEVLVNEGGQVQGLRVFDATVARRLDGEPLSIPGQDDATIAWVTMGVTGAPVLRVQPTPDRAVSRSALDAMDLPLPLDPGCRIAGADDVVVWHDGASLREVDLATGDVRDRVDASSTSGSPISVDDRGRTHVVDPRGVVRRFDRGLGRFDVLPIGDDPVRGQGVDEGVVAVAGGTGGVTVLGPSAGYVRGVGEDGANRWLVRIRGAVASGPVLRGGTVAVRQVDGAVALLRDGLFVADVAASPTALEPPLLDARGVVLRDGRGVAAAFPAGEVAWATEEVATQPGLASDGDVVVARGMTEVVGLDRATGVVRWRQAVVDTAGQPTTPLSVPTIAGDRVLLAVHDGIVVLDLATGQQVDRAPVPATLAGPIVPSTVGVVACLASGDLALVG